MAGFEEGFRFIVVNIPLDAMYDVPCSNTVNIIPDCAASVCAYECGNEAGEDRLVNRCPMFFADVLLVAEQVEDEKAGTISAASLRGVSFP